MDLSEELNTISAEFKNSFIKLFIMKQYWVKIQNVHKIKLLYDRSDLCLEPYLNI